MYEGWFGIITQVIGLSVFIISGCLLVAFAGISLDKWAKRPSRAARLRRKAKRLYEKALRMEE